jgi:ATP-dependent Lhr-like helicase
LPQFLGYEICQRILRTLREDESFAYLDDPAAAVLAARRDEMRAVLSSDCGGIEAADDEIRWWTFAGGRINATLRYALEAVGGVWKVIPDNFLIKVRGENLSIGPFREALSRLREIEFWENDKLWAGVAQSLPSYRLSKFQPLMPPWVEREVVAGYLLDVAGAWRWLSGSDGHLPRVSDRIRTLTRQDEARAATLEAVPQALPRLVRDDSRRLVWVRSAADLVDAVAALMSESVIGLDVETTLGTRTLCLIQIAGQRVTYLIDSLDVSDLSVMAPLLSSRGTTKVIHCADFEREVLGRHGLVIEPVVDTREVSRCARGDAADGGHSLQAVCARELRVSLDKTEQTGDWGQRPLTEKQIAYAALDAEVLLRLCEHFRLPAHA